MSLGHPALFIRGLPLPKTAILVIRSGQMEIGNAVDILLVHQPSKRRAGPLINVMPMGLIPIASALRDDGFSVQILHTGVEERLRPDFSLVSYVKEAKPVLCGFTLHWHQQAADTMRAVSDVKRTCPGVHVSLGGLTASRFAHEILSDFPDVDSVIKGDGERPLARLAAKLKKGDSDLSSVPNLVYRSDSGMAEGRAAYQADRDSVSRLSYAAFELVSNYEHYLRLRMNSSEFRPERVFYFSPGRGCVGSCSFCGGSREAFAAHYNREAVLWFPEEYVISQLKAAAEFGASIWNNCFDPEPASQYYPRLFRRIRREKLRLSHAFDCFGLPTGEFINEFQLAFDPTCSAINLSPESGSEELRGKVKGFSYGDEKLFETLEILQNKNISCSVYFSTGHPQETRDDFKATCRLIESIRRRYPAVRAYAYALELEPGSLNFEEARRHGIKTSLHSLRSLIAKQEQFPASLGYSTRHFSEAQIIENGELLKKLCGPG